MNNISQPGAENQDGGSISGGDISVDSMLRTVAYCIIFVLGLVGNVFVVIALKRKKRKTANDWFILNLTISDLLLIACLISDVYLEVAKFSYNVFFCNVLRPLSTLAYFVSIFTITAMALERRQVITKPFHPKMEQKCTLLIIGGIWVLAVIFTVPLPIVTSPGLNECQEEWPEIVYQSIYTVVLAVLQYFLPLAIITAAYIQIVIYLWKEKASQQALNIQARDTTLRTARKDNIQAVKAVLTVVIFFAVCLLPSQLAWLLWEFGKANHKNIAKELLKFSPITSYLNSCANPIIYGTFMAYFRKELKVWLSQCSSCCPRFSCVWRRKKNVHRFQVSSAQIETHQKFTHTAKDNIVDINDETLRSREMSKVTRHKQTLDSEIRGQINLANEHDFQETEF